MNKSMWVDWPWTQHQKQEEMSAAQCKTSADWAQGLILPDKSGSHWDAESQNKDGRRWVKNSHEQKK